MSWILTTRTFQEIILPAIDILILSFLIYRSYQILIQTKAIQLVRGAALMALIYAVAFFFKLQTLLWVLNLMVPGLVIGVAIIFQPELRKIFTQIGQGGWFKFTSSEQILQFDEVIQAAVTLSNKRRGGLIVIARQVGLKNYIDTGTRLDAEITAKLIITIFGHDTPLHDGALIIEGGKIAAAGCFLPLSEQPDIRRSFGTRHRAALGLAEETDAVVVVVSEESGAISLAFDGNLIYDIPEPQLRKRLRELFIIRGEGAIEETEEGVLEE
ncbi:MAG: diadenylate cyclase CdaA [Spirochaetes bacterium]|nr:diadenylate cyclase CdaA [Spirochaetota bacterium]